MKRVRIYQQIISDENLRLAIQEVNRGHRRNGDHSLNKKVMEIEAHIDEYVVKLRKFIEDLVTGDEHMHKPLQRRKWDRNADSGKGNGGISTSRSCGRTSMSTMRWCSL